MQSQFRGSLIECERKLRRAIDSFIAQSYDNKELVIVSDGCNGTNTVVRSYLELHSGIIKLISIDKMDNFCNVPRNMAVTNSTGEVVCYLDNDDFLGKNHLEDIANGFGVVGEVDWVYYEDHIVTDSQLNSRKRDIALEFGRIGGGCVAHKKLDGAVWENGYCADWVLISFLIKNYPNSSKRIETDGYYVCHIPTQTDF